MIPLMRPHCRKPEGRNNLNILSLAIYVGIHYKVVCTFIHQYFSKSVVINVVMNYFILFPSMIFMPLPLLFLFTSSLPYFDEFFYTSIISFFYIWREKACWHFVMGKMITNTLATYSFPITWLPCAGTTFQISLLLALHAL